VPPEIYPPISDYALISDCHSGALVSKDGSIDWCTFHRFEARPVFGRNLDWAKAGFFRIAPLDDDYESNRRYLPATNVLETTFRTPGGTLVLTDFFAYRMPAPGEDALSAHPDHQLIRIARCTEGEVAVKVKLVPRFDYGLTTPRLETLADDLVIVYGGADALVVQSELPYGHAELSATQGNRTLQAGEEAFVALTYQLPHELEPHPETFGQQPSYVDIIALDLPAGAPRAERRQIARYGDPHDAGLEDPVKGADSCNLGLDLIGALCKRRCARHGPEQQGGQSGACKLLGL